MSRIASHAFLVVIIIFGCAVACKSECEKAATVFCDNRHMNKEESARKSYDLSSREWRKVRDDNRDLSTCSDGANLVYNHCDNYACYSDCRKDDNTDEAADHRQRGMLFAVTVPCDRELACVKPPPVLLFDFDYDSCYAEAFFHCASK